MDDELKKVLDKILLFLSALALGLCLLVYFNFLDKLKIIEEWKIYISMSIFYVLVFIYGINKMFGLKNKVINFMSLLSLIFFAISPVIVGFILFYFKFLPFPKTKIIYPIIILILAIITIQLFDKSLSFFKRRKHSSTTKKEKSLNDL